MNQIEFIKKWAKDDYRIEDDFKDSERKFLYNGAGGVLSLVTWERFDLENVCWQSPKIYRSLDPIEWESKKGYTEGWELIADYADEKKEESLLTLHQRLLNNGVSIPHHDAEIYRSIESRLKALEDKIK